MPSNSLEPILNIVKAVTRRKTHVIVYVDPKTGKVVPAPLLGPIQIFSRPIAYELKLEHELELYDEAKDIRVFATREDARLKFRLWIRAHQAQADRIVESLADRTLSPYAKLMQIVEELIKREAEAARSRNPGGLLEDIAADREGWQSRIAHGLSDRTGLEARIIFEDVIPAERGDVVQLRHHEVHCIDAPHLTLKLSLQIRLRRSGNPVIVPLPSDSAGRQDAVRRLLGSRLPPDITLYDLWYDLERVQAALQQALTAGLAQTGYSVEAIHIEPVPAHFAVEEHAKVTVHWSGRAGRNIPFFVEATLRLRRDGAGRYDATRISSRETWLRASVERLLPKAMQGRDFEDLDLGEQAVVSETLVNDLRAEALATGQDIRPVLARVLLPEYVFLQGKRIEIPRTKFKTRGGLALPELSMSIDVTFRTLRRVIQQVRLRPDFDGSNSDYSQLIERTISEIAISAADLTLSQTETNDYYASYDAVGAASAVTVSVKEQLKSAIDDAIHARLGPEHVTVTLRQNDTEVELANRQMRALDPLECQTIISPRDMQSSAQRVVVNVRARVGGLDPGQMAQVIMRGEGGLRKGLVLQSLEGLSRQFLNLEPLETLVALGKGRTRTGLTGEDAPFQRFEDYLNRHMVDHYGFTVRLEHVEPEGSAEYEAFMDARARDAQTLAAQNASHRQRLAIEAELAGSNLAADRALMAEIQKRMAENERTTDEDLHRYSKDDQTLQDLRRRIQSELNRYHDGMQATPNSLREALSAPRSPSPPPPRPAEPVDDATIIVDNDGL